MTDPQPPRTLTSIKQYRLVREIGRGGMGTVYEGIDNRDGSRVAIKLLHPWLVTADPSYRERFEREAHIAALLRSPYTVRLVDFGVAEGFHYLVMEFVEGTSLADAIDAGPLEPARALRIAIDTARALEEADARGVVHRDIKPGNILLTPDGGVKVADFGIARHAGGSGVTMAGTFVGTADYAAPEQALGDSDTRSDVYSVGATLYCMLAGHPPFQGATATEVLRMHQQAEPPDEPLAHLPASIVNPVRRCLEKDPRDRYQTPTELGSALERALAAYTRSGTHSPASAPPARGSTSASRPSTTGNEATVLPPPPTHDEAAPTSVVPPRELAPPGPPMESAPRPRRQAAGARGTGGRSRRLLLVVGVVVIAVVAVVAVVALRGGSSDTPKPARSGAAQASAPAASAASGAPSSAAQTIAATKSATAALPTAVLPTPVLTGFPTLPLPANSPDREIIDAVNRNGPAYADAINRRDTSNLAGVFAGDALAQFTQEVHDEQAKSASSQSSLLSITLAALQPSPTSAAVQTKERWRYQLGSTCNVYSYDESYQLTLTSGLWRVSKDDSTLTATQACS